MDNALKNLKSMGNLKDLEHIKPALYFGLALAVFVYILQRVIGNSRSKASSRTATRSPDPEKPAGTRVKPAERPPGGKCTLYSE